MNTPKDEETIFAAALALPPEQRAACLDQACGGDAALRHRVEVLLNAHAASDFLEAPAAPAAMPTLQVSPPVSERAGDRIGRYKLLQQIGEGGCGVVYMAEQDEPVQRRVALKVIKLGMDTKQVIARFEAERQALALMDHPNIAKVLDGGATETGRLYFVMELVRGIKITEFCDHNNLPTRERLELFMQVCRAIQHAHQKGIIHRDIKPSNILVTINDGVSVPKVIDFGIAKATQGRLTDKTLFTAFEQFIGTPAYMSPEQAVMTSLDIDTRSDIYSLGVLLYELLTGKTPFDSKELLEAGLDAMRRTIQEQEPQRPSTKLSTMVEGELTTTAKRHHTDAPKLISDVRGDLDWIVMKCLEKDRARRYETANGLASDLQRHLDQEPVNACPPSNLYRFQKLVRRNKLAFAAAAAVAASLLIGLGISTWMFFQERAAKQEQARLRLQAEAQEQKAQTEAAKSQQVAQFLKDMLQGVGSSVALGRDTTILREILDKAAERVGKELTNQPEVEADLCNAIGEAYVAISQGDKAVKMYREALAVGRRLPGEEHDCLATSLHDLGWALWVQDHLAHSAPKKLAEAEASFREAQAIRRKLFGNEHRDVAASLIGLGYVLNVQPLKLAEAETTMRAALAMRRRLFGDEHQDVADSLKGLAYVLLDRGEVVDAESTMREALAMERKHAGDEQPEKTAMFISDLAVFLERRGKFDEAEQLCREAIQIKKKLHTAEKALRLEQGRLSEVLAHQGRLAEAEAAQREAVESSREEDDRFILAGSLVQLGNMLRRRDKQSEAQTVYAEALPIYRKMADDGDAAAQTRTGCMYQLGQGVAANAPEAVRWFRAAAEQGDALAQGCLGDMYRQGQGVAEDAAEAVKWHRKAAEQGDALNQAILGDMYRRGQGVAIDAAEAVKWYRKATEYGLAIGQIRLGVMYANGEGVAKDPAEAVKWYRKAADEGDPTAQYNLGVMYQRGEGVTKDLAEALKWYRKAAESGDAQGLNELAWTLATSGDPNLRDGTNAIVFAQKALAAANRKDPAMLDTLAAAFAEASEFDKAVSTQKEAIALLQDEAQKKDFGTRLKLYESNSPYHEP